MQWYVCRLQSVRAVPKLVCAWQGGFSLGNVRKKPLTCRFTHEHVYAKTCSKHPPYTFTLSMGTRLLTSQSSGEKNRKALREAWLPQSVLSAVSCSPCKPLPAQNICTRMDIPHHPHGLDSALFSGLLLSSQSYPASVKYSHTGQLVPREQELRKPEQERQCPLCIMRLDSCQIPLHPLPLLNASIISWQSKPQRRVERQLQTVQLLSLKGEKYMPSSS